MQFKEIQDECRGIRPDKQPALEIPVSIRKTVSIRGGFRETTVQCIFLSVAGTCRASNKFAPSDSLPKCIVTSRELINKNEAQKILSLRELEVLKLKAMGKSATEIGSSLEISSETVTNHTRSIFSKLDSKSTLQAVIKAYKLDILNPDEWVNDEEVARTKQLKANEKIILDDFLEGDPTTNDFIANKYKLTPSKIQTQVGKILRTLVVDSRVQAATIYYVAKKRNVI